MAGRPAVIPSRRSKEGGKFSYLQFDYTVKNCSRLCFLKEFKCHKNYITIVIRNACDSFFILMYIGSAFVRSDVSFTISCPLSFEIYSV